jgi:hypothetical protein
LDLQIDLTLNYQNFKTIKINRPSNTNATVSPRGGPFFSDVAANSTDRGKPVKELLAQKIKSII